jgi:hypothetical protein
MKNIGKTLLLLFLGTMFFGCEKSLVDDPPVDQGRRNFMMRFDYTFNGVKYNRDTVIVLGPEIRFRITDVNFLISNAFATRSIGDSIYSENMFTWTSLSETDYFIGEIPAGNYNGNLGFTFGLDSITNMLPPSEFPRTVLSENNLYLDPLRGYSFIRIRGNAFDPTKEDEIVPSLPFDYIVATTPLALPVFKPRAFALGVANVVVYEATIDIGSLFDGLNPVNVRNINSDFMDLADYERATKIMQNFAVRGFAWK